MSARSLILAPKKPSTPRPVTQFAGVPLNFVSRLLDLTVPASHIYQFFKSHGCTRQDVTGWVVEVAKVAGVSKPSDYLRLDRGVQRLRVRAAAKLYSEGVLQMPIGGYQRAQMKEHLNGL